MLLVAEPEEDPVVRRRGDQQQRGGAGSQQRGEVQDLLKAGEPRESRGERDRQEKGEKDLHAGLRDPDLLQELDQVAVTALEHRLVASIAADLLAHGGHAPSATQAGPQAGTNTRWSGFERSLTGQPPTRISFLLTNSCMPNRPSSRPKPDDFTPPKGSSTPSAPTALMKTMPASIWSATRRACSESVV